MMFNRMRKSKLGFTLVELLVVLVIMAILAAAIIPSMMGFIDKAKASDSVSSARQSYLASSAGLLEWKNDGSPGNGDKAYKINIENDIIAYMGMGNIQSFTATNSTENAVQVALSLPTYFSQGWATFINDCKNNGLKNFTRVWIGKNADNTVGDTIKAIYYVSADGKTASRIVYDGATKLGSPEQKVGSYTETIA